MLIGISGKKGHGKDAVAKMIQVLTGPKTYQQGFMKPPQPWEYVAYNVDVKFGPFQIRKYADTLKDMVCVLLKCTRAELEDNSWRNYPLGEEWSKYRATVTKMYVDEYGKEYYEDRQWYWPTKRMAELDIKGVKKESHIGGFSVVEDGIEKVEMSPRLIMQTLGTEWGRQIIHPNIWVLSTFRQFNENSNWIITDVRFPNEANAIKDRGGVLIRVNRPTIKSDDYHLSETALDDYEDFDYIITNESLEDLQQNIEDICTELGLI